MIRADYLSVGGADAYVEQWSPQGPTPLGRPLLCIHTAGQSGVQWRHAAPGLASRGWRVIVPDLPGHGRSDPAPAGPIQDLRDYGAWCEALVDALDLERPHVAGCSIGGKIALDLAVRRGPRLGGVLAMAADGGLPAPAAAAMARGLQRELEDSAAPSRGDRTWLGTLAVVGRRIPSETAARIALMHRREDPVITTSDLIGWARFDAWDALPAVRCPVHLVVGSDDLWLDAARVRRAAGLIPGARCTVLDGIGHYPMEELEDAAAFIDGCLREMEDAAGFIDGCLREMEDGRHD